MHILGPNPMAPNNSITTALYTWYTFPTIGVIELLLPWKKFANFYFLCVGAMQMWKEVSLTQGQPSSYMTLTFICIVELFFKGRENAERVRGDRLTNNSLVDVLAADASIRDGSSSPPAGGSDDGFRAQRWSEVKVGDVVRVKSRETFPADLLLLRASDPPGQCWVNTKPLDGETDSKLVCAGPATFHLCSSVPPPPQHSTCARACLHSHSLPPVLQRASTPTAFHPPRL